MHNKIFVGFIALIMLSHIHKVMNDKKLYKLMTMDELLITMSRLRIAYVNEVRFIRPITKMQKYILDAFAVESPVG
jgi:hypothetical protein